MRNKTPTISFTFDDFPKSALLAGGSILEEHGAVGTYYTSLGLMDKAAPSGEMFTRDDIYRIIERGHEIGCHTFAHCHAAETSPEAFEASILDNQQALRELAPNAEFKTLSYPIGNPRPATKRRSSRYFSACRAGGQDYNSGRIDLNSLRAFFIEQSRNSPDTMRAMIDETCRVGAWLIFATHDISNDPSPFGCSPGLFRNIVEYSARSGARMLPVSEALTAIRTVDEVGE
jgi:hypothetical protein